MKTTSAVCRMMARSNNSLLFDLAIILQTAEVVFMGKGAR